MTEHLRELQKELQYNLHKKLAEKARVVLAIDGTSAALKSTLAAYLAEVFDGAVVHCDDFFLPMELRSKARYREPGGNVHYERLKIEIIDRLHGEEEFNYRRYDCKMCGFGELVRVADKRLVIVEGAYAMHPYLGKYYDLSLFLTVDPAVQMERIEKRSPNPRMFREKWIPLEQAYFEAYDIAGKADMILDTTYWRKREDI